MKKIALLSLVFITALVKAQEKPTTYFRHHTGTATISKDEAMEMDTIKAHSKDSKLNLTIVSYEFTVAVDGKAPTKNKHVSCKGSVLSKEAKELLKQVTSGSKIYVDTVTATDSKGKTEKVQGMTLTVK